MKKLLVLMLAMAIAGSAFAVVDEDADMIGVYFDTNADTYCASPGAGMFFNFYVILTNPSTSTIDGFQYSLQIEGDLVVPFPAVMPAGTNVGTDLEPIHGLGAPLTCAPATVLATYYGNFSAATQYFTLAAHPEAFDAHFGYDLPAVTTNSIMRDVGFSTMDGTHCAVLNGDCDIVATEDVTFDSVKSLYR